jgi:hypothetical protein
MRAPAFGVDNEADTTGIVFVTGIVEATGGRRSCVRHSLL